MDNREIFIGAHGATAVVFFLADNMNFVYIERVRGADNGADVKVMLDVLDGDFKAGASFV